MPENVLKADAVQRGRPPGSRRPCHCGIRRSDGDDGDGQESRSAAGRPRGRSAAAAGLPKLAGVTSAPMCSPTSVREISA